MAELEPKELTEAEVLAQVTEKLKQKAVFIPCESKEALHAWIKTYLDLDMPDGSVDPDSNSSPMELIWEIYNKAYKNDDPDFAEVMAYAARAAFKTLAAAVLEVLMVVHLDRSVAHMAAIKPQAQKAQSYVRDLFNKPYLRKFVVGDNDAKKEFCRYTHKITGDSISEKEFSKLDSPLLQSEYEKHHNYISVVVCTMAGANSEHVNFMCVDELEVIPNIKAYEEAKMIPDSMNGKHPITLYTSTRKFSFGLVQNELDNAHETGLHVRHWNLIDVTKKCPKSRHKPHLPIIDVYYSDDRLETISPEKYAGLAPKVQEQFQKDTAFHGCLHSCEIFAACRGRLATRSVTTSELVKPVTQAQTAFRKVETNTAIAQLLCRKPSTTGLIYPYFDRGVHGKTASEIAEMVTGEEYPEDMSKLELILLLKSLDCSFVGGMDFGYTHNFVVTVGAVYGRNAFILECASQAEIELTQQIELCDHTIKHYNAKIYADPENPQNIKTFKKHGYRMLDWKKGAGSVLGGIAIVRMKLKPTGGSEPTLFFLKDDPGVEFLMKRISQYHWRLKADGEASDEPNDKDDDENDSLRYMVMNAFAKEKTGSNEEPPAPQAVSINSNWIKQKIQEVSPENASFKGKSGNLIWDI